MKKQIILAILGLAVVMVFAAPSKASAEVVVRVQVRRVVPRPAYVVVAPRPYYPYAYYPRPVVIAPRYVRPLGFYYRERWCPRPYAYRGYYRPHYFRR